MSHYRDTGQGGDAVAGSDLGWKHANEPDVRWRVTTGNGTQFTCCVYTTDAGTEVRLMTGDDELLCSRVVPSIDAAGTVARRWLRTVVASEAVSEPSSAPTIVH